MFNRRSIARNIIILFAVTVAIVVVAFFGLSTVIRSQHMVTNNIGELIDGESRRDYLYQDQYDMIDDKDIPFGDIMVFDDSGKLLYVSDEKIGSLFTFADVDFLPDAIQDTTWTVTHTKDESRLRYLVTRIEHSSESNLDYILGYCILNGELEVEAGTLFQDRGRLTAKELELLQGSYHGYGLEVYRYTNAKGEGRVLLSATDEQAMDAAMDKQIRRSQWLWFLMLPLFLTLILGWVLALRHMLNRYLAPLDRAVANYGRGERSRIDPEQVPSEVLPLVEDFNEMADRLEAADEEKDEAYRRRQAMIADISHDLRTPLTVIGGYSQAFLEGKVPAEKQIDYMRTIHDKAEASSAMLETLLDYNRLEHPEYRLETTTMNLAEVCREYLAEKYEELKLQGIPLEVDIPEDEIAFTGDGGLLTRVFDNLIGNAVKHNEGKATIYFTLRANPEKVRITIADDGTGIPPVIRENLFAPFVTGKVARTGAQGSGLGMAIAKKIVELHRGTIRLLEDRETSHATEFEIILPR